MIEIAEKNNIRILSTVYVDLCLLMKLQTSFAADFIVFSHIENQTVERIDKMILSQK
jgi:hypothetical protein